MQVLWKCGKNSSMLNAMLRLVRVFVNKQNIPCVVYLTGGVVLVSRITSLIEQSHSDPNRAAHVALADLGMT